MSSALTQASKFLSLLLRHQPDAIGLTLSSEGWARVSDLVCLTQGQRVAFTPALIEQIVSTSDKQRFVYSENREFVRANQGHSIAVDLGLSPLQPPDVLYHGTAARFVDAIFRRGLLKQSRQHVHLSPDPTTAEMVGRRHGEPVILRVDAAGLSRTGMAFFRSENGVWLVEHVPADFLAKYQ